MLTSRMLIEACLFLIQPAVIGSAIVDLNYTTYEGLRLSNGVNAFLGMRYAAPPLGNLRWRAPVEPERLSGRIVPASKVCREEFALKRSS